MCVCLAVHQDASALSLSCPYVHKWCQPCSLFAYILVCRSSLGAPSAFPTPLPPPNFSAAASSARPTPPSATPLPCPALDAAPPTALATCSRVLLRACSPHAAAGAFEGSSRQSGGVAGGAGPGGGGCLVSAFNSAAHAHSAALAVATHSTCQARCGGGPCTGASAKVGEISPMVTEMGGPAEQEHWQAPDGAHTPQVSVLGGAFGSQQLVCPETTPSCPAPEGMHVDAAESPSPPDELQCDRDEVCDDRGMGCWLGLHPSSHTAGCALPQQPAPSRASSAGLAAAGGDGSSRGGGCEACPQVQAGQGADRGCALPADAAQPCAATRAATSSNIPAVHGLPAVRAGPVQASPAILLGAAARRGPRAVPHPPMWVGLEKGEGLGCDVAGLPAASLAAASREQGLPPPLQLQQHGGTWAWGAGCPEPGPHAGMRVTEGELRHQGLHQASLLSGQPAPPQAATPGTLPAASWPALPSRCNDREWGPGACAGQQQHQQHQQQQLPITALLPERCLPSLMQRPTQEGGLSPAPCAAPMPYALRCGAEQGAGPVWPQALPLQQQQQQHLGIGVQVLSHTATPPCVALPVARVQGMTPTGVTAPMAMASLKDMTPNGEQEGGRARCCMEHACGSVCVSAHVYVCVCVFRACVRICAV